MAKTKAELQAEIEELKALQASIDKPAAKPKKQRDFVNNSGLEVSERVSEKGYVTRWYSNASNEQIGDWMGFFLNAITNLVDNPKYKGKCITSKSRFNSAFEQYGEINENFANIDPILATSTLAQHGLIDIIPFRKGGGVSMWKHDPERVAQKRGADGASALKIMGLAS